MPMNKSNIKWLPEEWSQPSFIVSFIFIFFFLDFHTLKTGFFSYNFSRRSEELRAQATL